MSNQENTLPPLALPWPMAMLIGLSAIQVAEVLVSRGFVQRAPSRRRGLEIVGTYVRELEK
jgi:hypothetical protein